MRWVLRILSFLIIIFILPSLLHAAIWSVKEKPDSWRNADWSSSGILNPVPEPDSAAIYVLAARTGGMKGAFATHSWLVIKKPGQIRYDRYEVVGWGQPVRKNAYDADGRWYSNDPTIHHRMEGARAAQLIEPLETAIAAYRWNKHGDYVLWPGPNSNTFIATLLRAVPELEAATPSTAVGRDYPAQGDWFTWQNGVLRITIGGYAGLVAGITEGIELNFLGLVAGINPAKGQLKIPSFGTFSW